jgi:hypothetical protein
MKQSPEPTVDSRENSARAGKTSSFMFFNLVTRPALRTLFVGCGPQLSNHLLLSSSIWSLWRPVYGFASGCGLPFLKKLHLVGYYRDNQKKQIDEINIRIVFHSICKIKNPNISVHSELLRVRDVGQVKCYE